MDSMGQSSRNRNVRVIEENRFVHGVFVASKFLGIFPFHLKNGCFRVSVPCCLISASATSFILYELLETVAPHFLPFLLPQRRTVNKPMTLVVFIWVIVTALYIISLAMSVLKVSSMNEIISALEEIDRLLIATDFWGQRRPSGFGLDRYVGYALLAITFLYTPWSLDVRGKIQVCLLAGCICLIPAQFSALGYLIRDRLAEANAVLSDLRYLAPYSLRKSRMTALSTVHNKLCDVCSVLESVFTLTLTASVPVSFFTITAFSFLIVTAPTTSGKPCLHMLLPSSSWDSTLPIIRMLFITMSLNSVNQIAACSTEITREIKEFNALLYCMMSTDSTAQNQILSDDHLMLHIAMKREFVFTACGFFNLDFTLLHSIIAAASTYLVILLQYGTPEQ